MLLPALNQARARGQAISCISNLKQLGTAFAMYVDSNGGYFPTLTKNAQDNNGNKNWYHAISAAEGLKGKVWVCPGFRNDPAAPPYGNNNIPTGNIHYGYNRAFFAGAALDSPLADKSMNISQLKYPTVAYTAMDSRIGGYKDRGAHAVLSYSSTGTDIAQGQPDARHSNSVNILYADGRAAARKVDPDSPYTELKSTTRKNDSTVVQWTGGRFGGTP